MMQDKVINSHNPSGNLGYPKEKSLKKALRFFGYFLAVLLIFLGLIIGLHLDTVRFLKDLLMLKFFPHLGKDTGFGLLFLLGLFTSFHCLGMCGGIIVSQMIPPSTGNERKEVGAWIAPALGYNLGRVIAYTLVGSIIGGVGQVITFIGIWKGVVPFIGGFLMIIMGINLLGIFPFLRRFTVRMPSFAFKKIRNHHYGPFLVGILNGFMPCGPLQIVQLYALSTRSVVLGALAMFCFAMGTVPLLFSFGTLASGLNKKYTNGILKISAILVILLGVVMMGRGLTLSGMMTSQTGNEVSADTAISHIDGNVQTVTIVIQSDKFPAIVVQNGLPVRWIIKADRGNLNGCNNAIIIPKLKIEKKFQVGENLIEFTPRQTGDIIYTCWMGMIKSKIIVVEDLANLKFKLKPAHGRR